MTTSASTAIGICGTSTAPWYARYYVSKIIFKTNVAQATIAGLSCVFFTMQPRFRTPAFRTMRSLSFSLLGLSAFIPVMHGIFINGWEVQNGRMSITYFLGLGILNGTGTTVYAARIPERWFPRTFDIYGSSHQIMHVLVVCGALSHVIGLLKAFDYWNERTLSGRACQT